MTLQDKDRLINVEKPSRYLDGEWNSVKPKTDGKACRIVLAYPDSYEIAQSSLGLKILYNIINGHPRASAQRVFAPMPDMEAFLKENQLPLSALESSDPIISFDVLGFTLQYPMTYTNLLMMLDLSGIPIYSRDRDKRHPLIIAGGPGAVNPEPVADFLDAILIGDGEKAVTEIIDTYNKWKDENSGNRQALLMELAKIDGIYVPSLYNVEYPGQGRGVKVTSACGAPIPVKKRFLSDLEEGEFPTAPVVPYVQTVHDRVMLEIFRGCTRGCRFCQAGFIYRPVRERSIGKILELARKSVESTGYDEISLLSLSSTDYSCIDPLLKALSNEFKGEGISFSLPSLRMDSSSLELLEMIRSTRKSSLTFAPEAGTQRLRDVINKNINDDDIINTLQQARSLGWQTVKLYFMMGLPTETDQDIDGIADVVFKALKTTGMKLHVSVSNFVPQPHTPFQWEAMETMENLQQKGSLLKRRLRNRKIKFNYHEPKVSYMECVLGRGDRRLAPVIEQAYKSGARFDGWSEYFNFELWMEAFRQQGINPDRYAAVIDPGENLPWDHLSIGVKKEYLESERQKALKGNTTKDCREHCTRCGICTPGGLSNQMKAPPDEPRQDRVPAVEGIHNQAVKLRLRMARQGALRWISHLDAQRALERGLRRAKVPVSYTEGFHPRPRVSFGLPLPLGYLSESEWVDLTLYKKIDPVSIKENLNSVMPDGFKVLRIRQLPIGESSLTSHILKLVFTAPMPPGMNPVELKNNIGIFMAREEVLISKKNKTVNARPFIDSFELVESEMGWEFVLEIIKNQKGSVKADQVMLALLGSEADQVGRWCRRELLVRQGRGWITP